jgi:hypothetical protein
MNETFFDLPSQQKMNAASEIQPIPNAVEQLPS